MAASVAGGRNWEVTSAGTLLNADGLLREPGWARSPLWDYDRAAVRAPWHRIKEWDYYMVWGDGFAVALTLSDIAFLGVQTVSFFKLDAENPWVVTKSGINAMPNGSMGFAAKSSDDGAVSYHGPLLKMDFITLDGVRHLFCDCANFKDGRRLLADIALTETYRDSLVVATPWPKPRHFYYNQKINGLAAEGFVQLGDEAYRFDPTRDFATLDWGRGAWTHDNWWWWSSCNDIVDGHSFGFNLGYGFADTTAATENIVYVDGVGHKLDDVAFLLDDPADYEAPWTVTSSDGRFEASFTPLLDRSGGFNLGFAGTDQHQVMGRMAGTVRLDDETALPFDTTRCFVERVRMTY